jgi:DNA helicase-2/ATP-dependent DNA helicase PcrA
MTLACPPRKALENPLAWHYSYAVNAQADGVKHPRVPMVLGLENALPTLFAAYVEAKQAKAYWTDDLLLYWAKMMEHPEVAQLVAQRFDHVGRRIPDTNALQASILSGLKPEGGNLTVVGDDAQSTIRFAQPPCTTS